MEEKTQKERLEQELRFLKESFEADVISKEEFEKGRDRIERKLKEIRGFEKEKIEETKKIDETETEKPKDIVVESKEPDKIKLKVIQDEPEEHEHPEPVQLKTNPQEKTSNVTEGLKYDFSWKKNESKFFKYASVFVVIILVAYFSYSLFKTKPVTQDKIQQLNFVAACKSDVDCRQQGKDGICLNPGAKDAKCEFKEIKKTNIFVLNDRKNCFNCDTQRVLAILENWFGALNAKEIDYNSLEGKNLAERLDAKILPSYIFDENISKNSQFEKFKTALIRKNASYVLSDDAAASTFYFKRDNAPNKIELFAIEGDAASMKAENNLKEFLEVFKEVKFEKYMSNDKITKELSIKNFPSFLINNRVKFSGVHSAETIKENFCKMNKLPKCEKSLSKNLV